MKRTAAALAAIALIGLGFPAPASATTLTFACEASTDPAPADWFGGPWSAPLRLVVDTTSRSVELVDMDNRVLGGTGTPSRLSGLNNYRMDVTVTPTAVSWGVIEMWGFSGYIDLRTGRLDVLWTNPAGYSPNTLTRQFHGTCKPR